MASWPGRTKVRPGPNSLRCGQPGCAPNLSKPCATSFGPQPKLFAHTQSGTRGKSILAQRVSLADVKQTPGTPGPGIPRIDVGTPMSNRRYIPVPGVQHTEVQQTQCTHVAQSVRWESAVVQVWTPNDPLTQHIVWTHRVRTPPALPPGLCQLLRIGTGWDPLRNRKSSLLPGPGVSQLLQARLLGQLRLQLHQQHQGLNDPRCHNHRQLYLHRCPPSHGRQYWNRWRICRMTVTSPLPMSKTLRPWPKCVRLGRGNKSRMRG